MVPFEVVQLYTGNGDTIATLKFTNPPVHHMAGFAEMDPGWFGFPAMLMVLGMLVPGVQAVVLAVTVKFPVVNDAPTLNRIVVLPCPLVMVVPAGFIQL